MIYSLTDQLNVYKDILKNTKLSIKYAIFNYILIENTNKKCVLCNLRLDTEFFIDKYNNIYTTKFKFLNFIFKKKSKYNFENNFFCKKCFIEIHLYPWPRSIISNYNFLTDKINLTLNDAKKVLSNSQEIILLDQHEKFKNSKIKRKELIKKYILYKIDIISEQLKLTKRCYIKAIVMKEEDNAELFRDLYNKMLEEKKILNLKIIEVNKYI